MSSLRIIEHLPKRFVRFLKEEGIFSDYLSNLSNQTVYFFEHIGFKEREVINWAFTWATAKFPLTIKDSYDMDSFWRHYDKKWKNFLLVNPSPSNAKNVLRKKVRRKKAST